MLKTISNFITEWMQQITTYIWLFWQILMVNVPDHTISSRHLIDGYLNIGGMLIFACYLLCMFHRTDFSLLQGFAQIISIR